MRFYFLAVLGLMLAACQQEADKTPPNQASAVSAAASEPAVLLSTSAYMPVAQVAPAVLTPEQEAAKQLAEKSAAGLSDKELGCRRQLANIDYTHSLNFWFKQVSNACAALSEEEQRRAFGGLTAPIGYKNVLGMQAGTVGELEQIINSGETPIVAEPLSEAEWWLAANQVYTAQRNYAFVMPRSAEKCAMRVLILAHPKADETDKGNVAADCINNNGQPYPTEEVTAAGRPIKAAFDLFTAQWQAEQAQ